MCKYVYQDVLSNQRIYFACNKTWVNRANSLTVHTAYLANIERFISCVLLQYEELVPYPAAFVPLQDLPGVWIRVWGLLQIPRAGIHPPAALLPQGKQECQKSQGSAYARATPPHHLGLLQNARRSKN